MSITADGVFDYLIPGDALYRTKRLVCGHAVSASEDSGGMDELPRVTMADVERLLDFKVATHDCGRYEAAERIRVEGRPFG